MFFFVQTSDDLCKVCPRGKEVSDGGESAWTSVWISAPISASSGECISKIGPSEHLIDFLCFTVLFYFFIDTYYQKSLFFFYRQHVLIFPCSDVILIFYMQLFKCHLSRMLTCPVTLIRVSCLKTHHLLHLSFDSVRFIFKLMTYIYSSTSTFQSLIGSFLCEIIASWC